MSHNVVPRVGGGVALGLAMLSAALHVAGLGHLGPVGAVLTLVMVVGCLGCGVHLLRTPSPRSWAMLVGMSSAMIAIHLAAMTMPMSHHSMAVSTHTGSVSAMSGSAGLTIAVAAIEVAFATIMLWTSTAHSRPVIPAHLSEALS
ncbi:hypothetical protein AAFP30_13675 [Gordonia sp. CPCC 205515]|uniref:hypothetical protein n=1 Tax=Gordonia sp. CPCC 205515 TaxID=3140791 RepID=UPI003AF3A8C1